MNEKEMQNSGCCSPPAENASCTCAPVENEDSIEMSPTREPACCGSPPEKDDRFSDRPGYERCHFVEKFVDTPAGPVPRVGTAMDRHDLLGTVRTRLGMDRDGYRIAPGLYCAGDPGPEAPVLVTANYKLSFDTLRRELAGQPAWILVLATDGVNVWCAAGKGTFSTEEVVRRVQSTGLERIVEHRELILPQLSATGVSAHEVKKGCGFRVIWGPVRAGDVKKFMEAGMKADKAMRRVTFSFVERLVLVPVELSIVLKYLLWVLLAAFLISGIGSGIFSLEAAWFRGLMVSGGLLAGLLAGAVLVPVLLPWIPARAFSIKGAFTGVIAGIGVVWMFWSGINGWEALALFLLVGAFSSNMAMNFTGATPFTSPSGVEKEMRKALPLQAVALLIAVIAWIGSAFTT